MNLNYRRRLKPVPIIRDGTDSYWLMGKLRLNELFFNKPYWKIYDIPAHMIVPTTANGSTLDNDTLEHLFDDSATETATTRGKLPTDYKIGTEIIPYVCWKQEAADNVHWYLELAFWDDGEEESVPLERNNSNAVYTYASGDLAQVTTFNSLTPDLNNAAANFRLEIARAGGSANDDMTGDAQLTSIGFMYQADKPGLFGSINF